MYWIDAKISNPEGDWDEELVIGLFTTPEKAIVAAREWVKKEREDGMPGDDICLCGWRAKPDTVEFDRLDLANDEEAKSIIKAFRAIEKEFPAIKEEDE